ALARHRHRRRPRSLRAAAGDVRSVLSSRAARGNRRRSSARGPFWMSGINQLFFDIGGVLGSNGWDREQRGEAVSRFGLDAEDFQYRHEETVGAFEAGQISLDEYLDVTVFWRHRDFSREEFKKFMLGLSTPWPDSLD